MLYVVYGRGAGLASVSAEPNFTVVFAGIRILHMPAMSMEAEMETVLARSDRSMAVDRPGGLSLLE